MNVLCEIQEIHFRLTKVQMCCMASCLIAILHLAEVNGKFPSRSPAVPKLSLHVSPKLSGKYR